MTKVFRGSLLALALGLNLSAATAAQQRPTMAIMPAQFFAADEQSADQVTQALVQEFEGQGYNVIPMDRSLAAFQEMGLARNVDIGDAAIRRFGRRVGASLVAHPQLMAMGLPAAQVSAPDSNFTPAAVLYLRVLNARTGGALYTRQIAYEFQAERPLGSDFSLTPQVASAAADAVTQRYFERVAGSRQEYRRGQQYRRRR
jgi:hypothetical protein